MDCAASRQVSAWKTIRVFGVIYRRDKRFTHKLNREIEGDD